MPNIMSDYLRAVHKIRVFLSFFEQKMQKCLKCTERVLHFLLLGSFAPTILTLLNIIKFNFF